MAMLLRSLKSAIHKQDSKALHRNLEIYAKSFPGLPIFDFFLFIRDDILKLTCQNFFNKTPIPNEKSQLILWLKEELKQSPLSISIVLTIAYINSYTGDLNAASKICRNAFIQYVHLLNTKNYEISHFNSWYWFTKYAVFAEPRMIDIKPFPFPKLTIPESLPENLHGSKTIITSYGNAPYIMRFAERFMKNIHTHVGADIPILLVVGDADEICKNHCKQLKQAYPQLHFAFETIPDKFNAPKILPAYCVLRRFTYLEDIFEAIGDHCLIALDLDLFINQNFKMILDKTKNVPFGFNSFKNDIFTSENLLAGRYVIFNNSVIAQRIRYHFNDYLRKKFQTGDIAWVMDQYALFHALQCANLTKQELASCYNISDACDNMEQFHFGTSEQEETLHKQERGEKETDVRFKIHITPENIIFDKKTLCPIYR